MDALITVTCTSNFLSATYSSSAAMLLKLTVRIEYASWKAEEFLTVERAKIGPMLRADLDRFKLPHPQIASIQPPTKTGIEFSYNTHDKSVRYSEPHCLPSLIQYLIRSSFSRT